MPGNAKDFNPFDNFEAFLKATHFNLGESRDDYPQDDSSAKKGSADSFDAVSVSGTTATIGEGVFAWAGRGYKAFAETGVTVAGGSVSTPGYISIRCPSDGAANEAEMVFTTSYPEDDGSYVWRPLHVVYLDGDGNAQFKRSCRMDQRVGAII